MMKAYPLLLEGISFRAHDIMGIYRIKEKIAVLHCAFGFAGAEVYMHSPFIMVCRHRNSGEILWRTKIGAYLYTEIKAENGVLYFGTDGNGGRFWTVNLSDGRTVYNYNSRETSNFLFYQDYVVLSNEKNKPVLLRRKDGAFVKALEFDGYKLTVHQQMRIGKDRLYAIASKKGMIYAVSTDLK